MTRVGWVDATGGVSGDMLLGAVVDAGVPVEVIQAAVDSLGLPEPVRLTAEPALRSGIGATKVQVSAPETQRRRTLPDVLALLDALDAPLRERATAVFEALAAAEAAVHRTAPEEVHFHEVGALDAVADVVGVVAGLELLGLDRLVCSPIALGGGRATTAHGSIPVPGPAVLRLLRDFGAPSFGGPVELELATPTGVALAVVLADELGPMPALRPDTVGVGAGSRDPADHTNVTRIVVGTAGATDLPVVPEVVLEANVDDLDPRLWPGVLAALMDAGANDAWLTPILMKKGRPAHTLSVLAPPARVTALERVVLAHTTTIGLRRVPVEKVALPRDTVTVDVLGGTVRVKRGYLDGELVTATPEHDDVRRLAAERGVPERVVLDAVRALVTRGRSSTS